jgi:hypothetical protein
MRSFILAIGIIAVACVSKNADATQAPGPSLRLFKDPYYTCLKNYYVANDGSDTNNGKSPTTAWATLAHADYELPGGGAAAGSCINVEPGIYNGVEITHGGNLASSTGYVVYRCTTMDACTVKGNAGVHNAEAFEPQWNSVGTPPNYLMFDGFVMAGYNASTNGVGVSAWNGTNGSPVASHHIWVLNSKISGFGQSGIGVAAGEYYYIIHNRISNNSNIQCWSQGSGIAINIMHTVPNYTPTADDLTNPNPMLGPTWVVGNSFFHNVIEWNIVNNNGLTQCGTPSNPTDTDGNGIIFDTNLKIGGNTQDYTAPSLAAFNIVYNNGGGGVHVFLSADVTIANNSCYNNEIDPGNGGTDRPCMDDANGYGNTFINNIAVAIPTYTGGNCWPTSTPFQKYNIAIAAFPSASPADTFSHNITHLLGTSCEAEVNVGNGDTYSCTNNKCGTSPAWTSVGTLSVGTETTQPMNADFALQPGSPAIGYGLTESYLPPSSVDAGACSSIYLQCR